MCASWREDVDPAPKQRTLSVRKSGEKYMTNLKAPWKPHPLVDGTDGQIHPLLPVAQVHMGGGFSGPRNPRICVFQRRRRSLGWWYSTWGCGLIKKEHNNDWRTAPPSTPILNWLYPAWWFQICSQLSLCYLRWWTPAGSSCFVEEWQGYPTAFSLDTFW